jgi:hypothetical protein
MIRVIKVAKKIKNISVPLIIIASLDLSSSRQFIKKTLEEKINKIRINKLTTK